jgi:hypothetical protein
VNPSLRQAQWLALGVPALLLAGAYVSQYGFGLYPCEMCWWQRYPHFAAWRSRWCPSRAAEAAVDRPRRAGDPRSGLIGGSTPGSNTAGGKA